MRKKILVLLIIISLIINIVACGDTSTKATDQEKTSDTNINNEQKTPSEATEDIKYEVDNDGGNFSKEDLIYFIMIDRFYDGNKDNNYFPDVNKDDPKSYHGGDLRGVIEKLDYIKSLGATAIWLTPVVDNEPKGYHGYWTEDFYNVDEHFGSLEDLKELVKKAHDKDIKVILDHVVNHTGYKSPWLNDPDKKDWFHKKMDITNWNDQQQVENGWLAGLPDLDQDNSEVREYLIKNTLWWIEETNVDGMRLDTVKHVPKDFWNEFAYEIKSEYPDFYLLGEVWNDNPRYLEKYHKIGIDGMTNYSLYEGIRNTFKRFGKSKSLIYAIKSEEHFSKPDINGIFIDNHDNPRLITETRDEAYLKQALTFVMTYPSIPIIYYGTEIGMEGANDPDNRKDMEWDKVDSSRVFDFYQKLVALREELAIKRGDFTLLDNDNYSLSYIRQSEDQSIIVAINLSNNEKEINIDIPTDNNIFIDHFNGNEYKLENGQLIINVSPNDQVILKTKE